MTVASVGCDRVEMAPESGAQPALATSEQAIGSLRGGAGEPCESPSDCCSDACHEGQCAPADIGAWYTLGVFAAKIPGTGELISDEAQLTPLPESWFPQGYLSVPEGVGGAFVMHVAPIYRNVESCGGDTDGPHPPGETGVACLTVIVEMAPGGPEADLWVEVLSWPSGVSYQRFDPASDVDLMPPYDPLGVPPAPGHALPIGSPISGSRVSPESDNWISHPATFEFSQGVVGTGERVILAVRTRALLKPPQDCSVEIECGDLVDDDEDGKVDCLDADCSVLPVCQPGAAGPGNETCTTDAECASGICVDGVCGSVLDPEPDLLPEIKPREFPVGDNLEAALVRHFIYTETPGMEFEYGESLAELSAVPEIVEEVVALYDAATVDPESFDGYASWLRIHSVFLLGRLGGLVAEKFLEELALKQPPDRDLTSESEFEHEIGLRMFAVDGLAFMGAEGALKRVSLSERLVAVDAMVALAELGHDVNGVTFIGRLPEFEADDIHPNENFADEIPPVANGGQP